MKYETFEAYLSANPSVKVIALKNGTFKATKVAENIVVIEDLLRDRLIRFSFTDHGYTKTIWYK